MESEYMQYDNLSEEYYYYYANESNSIDYSHLYGVNSVKKVLQPVLVVLGTLGNLLALKVLRSKPLCHQSVSFYISAYILMCTLILFVHLGCEWLFSILHRPSIKSLTDWGCRLWQFVFNVVIYSVQWLIVALSVDRYMAIWHPLHGKRLCTNFSSRLAVVMIAIGLVVVSIHALWTFFLVEYSNLTFGCIIEESDLYSKIWIWFSGSMYKFIPLVILLISNTMTLVGLFAKRDTLYCPGVRKQKLHKLTNVSVALTSMFLLNTAPVTIFDLVGYLLQDKFQSDIDLYIHYSFINEVCMQLAYIHLATSFLLCMIFSKPFRKQFFIMVRGALKCSTSKGCKNRKIKSFTSKKSSGDNDSAGETAV